MKLTVLGCGPATVGGKKAGSGYLIDNGTHEIVLDLGYGAHKNLQKATDFTKLTSLFFSHLHPDHCYDLGAFLDQKMSFISNGLLEEKTQVNIFGPEGVKEFYSGIIDVFPSLKNIQFKVTVSEMNHSEIKLLDFKAKSKPLKHGVTTLAYRIESSGKTIVYSADTEYCQEIVDLGAGADLLILECSVPEDRRMSGHLTPADCARIAVESNPKKLLLTHFFPYNDEEKAKQIVEEKFKGEVLIAKDLMEIEV